MRVLMVDAGGFSPPYDYALTGALRDSGVDVSLMEPAETRAMWQDPDAFPDRAPVTGLRWMRQVRKGAAHALNMAMLLRRVEREQPDLVHFQWLPLPVVDSVVLKRLSRRLPIVFTMHNTSLFHGSASSGLQGWKAEDAYKAFDRIIVHSQFGKRSALSTGRATPNRIVCIPHGAFSHYAQLSSPDNIDRTGPTQLLFVGSIKPYKGLDTLVRALHVAAQTLPANRSVRLVVAGNPAMPMGPITDLAKSLGVESLIDWKLRHLSERELAVNLARCDAVVLPYREIDQSGVLLAAVAMHRAVIASNIGGIPEVIHDGINGRLVPAGDYHALGGALSEVASSKAFRMRCESAMKQLADGELSWSSVAARTIALYRSILRT